MLSVSSYGSEFTLNVPASGLSRTNSHRKPPKQRLTKLIKSSLKHTLKSNNSDSSNIEYWNSFYKKLNKIINSFSDKLSLYDALNDPYINSKSTNKTSSSIIHILCKQFYLYSRSNNWSVCFKIWDSILLILENGANTSIFYTKLNEPPQQNYNSIHTLYQGLIIMLSSEIITNQQFVNYFSRTISSGNEEIHIEFVNNLHEILEIESNNISESLTSLPSIISTQSSDGKNNNDFNPAVLTLCIYKQDIDENEWEWQNITYWLGDCLYHDYYVNLISPHLAKGFIMMGYDLFHICLTKLNHLNYKLKDQTEIIINDLIQITQIIDDNHETDMIHHKVIAFLWFIRFGNFKNDLINIVDIGITQLARDEFVIDNDIIEQILEYSHNFVMINTMQTTQQNDMEKLNLSYFDEDKWMINAFEILFKLDNIWIDWIGQYVIPQLTKEQISKIKQNLSENVTDKQWNKFIRRISLKSINSFCKHDIFGVIDTNKMQNIINKNYRDSDLIPIIINANYDIEQTFGNSKVLFKILNDATMDNVQIDNILNAIHQKIKINKDLNNNNNNNEQKENITSNNSEKLLLNDLLFGSVEWKINDSIWRNISLVFNNSKYKYFCAALCDLFYELITEQHHDKFVYFMKNDMIDFNYCLNKEGLIENLLQTLINEEPFDQQASCIQIIGDWIYTNYQNEKDSIRKKEIANKAITVIAKTLTPSSPKQSSQIYREQVIIEQYLQQLKTGLSR